MRQINNDDLTKITFVEEEARTANNMYIKLPR